jgi:hypothetical protein
VFCRWVLQTTSPARLARPPTREVTGAQALRACESCDCELQYDGHHQRLRLVHLSVINAPVFLSGRRHRGECSRDRWLANWDLGHRRHP